MQRGALCRSRRELSNARVAPKGKWSQGSSCRAVGSCAILNWSSLSMYFSYVPSIIFSFFNRPLFSQSSFQIDPNSILFNIIHSCPYSFPRLSSSARKDASTRSISSFFSSTAKSRPKLSFSYIGSNVEVGMLNTPDPPTHPKEKVLIFSRGAGGGSHIPGFFIWNFSANCIRFWCSLRNVEEFREW